MDYDPPAGVRGRFTDTTGGGVALPVHDTAYWRAVAPALDPGRRAFVAAAYDEEVAFVDQEVGRLLDALEARGLLERTLVVLTADHGEELIDHDGFGHGQTMFEEQIRVPLILLGPGVRPGRHETPVSIGAAPRRRMRDPD